MKWKAELVRLEGDQTVTDAFLRQYCRCVLLALKEEGSLTQTQFRRAEEILSTSR